MNISPDCRDENHGKCDTVAWDDGEDDYAPCECDRCNHFFTAEELPE